MSPKSPIVRKAVQASARQLMEAIQANIGNSDFQRSISYTIFHAQELSSESRQIIWDILDVNMAAMYNASSSFKWDIHEKKEELFHSDSRFILALDESEVVAYTMFRFEYEDERLLYCYELQVVPAKQGQGLGKRLMQYLALIGTRWRMEKLMLTVFQSNAPALGFYEKLGFVIDPSNPSPGDVLDDGSVAGVVDYRILSLPLL